MIGHAYNRQSSIKLLRWTRSQRNVCFGRSDLGAAFGKTQLISSRTTRNMATRFARKKYGAIDAVNIRTLMDSTWVRGEASAPPSSPRLIPPYPAPPYTPHRPVPHRATPYCTVLYRTDIPHSTAPHRTASHRTAPHRTASHRTASSRPIPSHPVSSPAPSTPPRLMSLVRNGVLAAATISAAAAVAVVAARRRRRSGESSSLGRGGDAGTG